MSESALERRYRRLLAWYPAAFRHQQEDEMLAVLMAGSRRGQRRPGLHESADLIRNALVIRARLIGSRSQSRPWTDGLALFRVAGPLLLLLASILEAAVPYRRVAVHLARKRGEDVPPALLAIQEAGADAVRELRATLGVLRSDEDGDGSGLGQLDSLVARAQAAGLPVTVTVTGAKRPLPSDVDQAAYRIVQEALTNVSRHAGPARASIQLHYAPETLSIQVDDDGQGTVTGTGIRPPGPGLGLVGMRERVSALGGRLQAGPQDDGGFRVRAELPARAPS